MSDTARVAFVGLGNMGAPMIGHLVRAGWDVRGFDLSPAACEAARAGGVDVASSLAEALDGAGTLVTMLPAGRHVLAVFEEAASLLPAGALHLDCSTIDIASARLLHERAAACDLLSVDAPVSGGTGGAAAATLTFMLGGTEAAVSQAMPLLERMGRRIVPCGAGGSGQAAKICNNMLLGISMIGVCEAFVLAEKLGLSHQALFDVASTSSGQCWSLSTYCPVPGPVPTSPANNDYRPGFASALMTKDLTLAQEAARDAGAETPLGRAALDLYAALVEAGEGGRDFSAMVEFLRARSAPETQGTAR
ncbi:3-hydroxyisobutyrate dehydrogenase [Aureimonas pseudogalii]|uniref:3-hydroxyisobutyrate dehydrogenase n=1 Tax=Aureimonas pseudogalii TaxID=1744844 RepID=A0A7W6EB38_9HYPH|nr:3-hydroxyisobutyrate dehydrogenase [Aureimonas pseudogalii]MBB3998062.1 3-hydroxyisobutyrate dehydrogenase [Aureimonas pseudogalii]